MTKKRKKRSSLTEIWDRIKEAVAVRDGKDATKAHKGLELLIRDVNNSELVGLLRDNFIKPYINFQFDHDIQVLFSSDKTGENSGITYLSEDGKTLFINPVDIYTFYKKIVDSAAQNISEDLPFEYRRAIAFHKEIIKLPEPYFIFIAVLGRISILCQVFTAEKRGGKKILPDQISMESYFPLLWALKQFEAFYKRVQNREMRSDFGIIWHEGEWVEK